MIDDLKAMLRRHEGVRLKPYLDTVGKTTIGIGRNLDDVGISDAEADFLLSNDIVRIQAEAERFPWFAGLNDARKVVILDMVFNLGLTRFRDFQKLQGALSRGDYAEAAWEMEDSAWARQTGGRAYELAQIMKTGEL